MRHRRRPWVQGCFTNAFPESFCPHHRKLNLTWGSKSKKKESEEREFRMRRRRWVNDNNNTNDLLDLCKLPLFVLLDEDKNKTKLKRPYLTKPLTHKGQLLRVRSHLEMQSRWKTCPQFPQAMLKPSSEAADGFAWYSMLGSWRLLRHIAHVSVHIDHDQTATAFHWDKCNINDTNVD